MKIAAAIPILLLIVAGLLSALIAGQRWYYGPLPDCPRLESLWCPAPGYDRPDRDFCGCADMAYAYIARTKGEYDFDAHLKRWQEKNKP